MPLADDFDEAVAPYRRELLTHCYQMLGSTQDAEDAVQETLLRAWRAADRYDASLATVRTWLNAIATNTCRTALVSRKRRPLPSALGAASDDTDHPLRPSTDVPWLEPIATSALLDERHDPAEQLLALTTVRLAFVAALQWLPPSQRAVLLLRDVYRYTAVETAGMLDLTVAAVNSSLQRARNRIGTSPAVDPDSLMGADAELVERFVEAFRRADLPALRRLLADDVVLEMPPIALWFRGPDDYVSFMERVYRNRGTDWHVVVTSANGQPALAAYVRDGDEAVAHSLQVLECGAAGIRRNTTFQMPDLFAVFGLPPRLPWPPAPAG
ncbi:MAG: RNA polymerase subunit sigma-70 [Ilumatobacteraceae bacterium]